jgi:hypothetical protein
MWFLGKKTLANPSSDAVAKTIAEYIVKKQRQLADHINSRTREIPRRTLKISLITIGIVFGSYCAYLLIQAIIN